MQSNKKGGYVPLSNITREQVKSMTDEILQSLIDNEVTCDVHLYSQNKAFCFEQRAGYIPYDDVPGAFISESDVDVQTQIEYCNPDTVTMTFEGDLYFYINERPDSKPVKDLNAILDKYGCYYEQGFAWSLAVYQ